jgi:hypothetical protein
VCSIGVASDTICPTKVGQTVDGTFKSVDEFDFLPTEEKEDSTILEEGNVNSFPTSIPHIEFVIPDKFNEVMESTTSMFSILPTMVPDLKHVLRVRILLLQHYKTQGRVFSNERSMMREHDIYFIFVLFNFRVDCMFILGLSI